MNTLNKRLPRNAATRAAPPQPHWRQALRSRWTALQPRERVLLAAAGGVAALMLLWWLALAPALAVLRNVPAQLAQAQAQRQQMAVLARQASALREQTNARPADTRAALATTTQNLLGTRATLAGTGDQVQITLDQIRPDELVDWLAQVRGNARLTPTEADLTATPAGVWRGTVGFVLPPPGP
ncbi:MAG: hypothetical protein GAK30_03460 [Paracidovorax wautersii]|uniref:General secretion pathway protein M n=1 Tax=Paracidovorax wautersii TaxID=1177982 RepID=A0A7V8JP64_9BURK|nr:MAG: hypothetical protein GAK30_03460 [Paracidovorax wautersii]